MKLDGSLYIRCPESMLKALDRYCKEHAAKHGTVVSRSNAARALLEKALNGYGPKQENKNGSR
jgi:hypothetical protein